MVVKIEIQKMTLKFPTDNQIIKHHFKILFKI